MRPLLIYIHGFNSSAESAKALEVGEYLKQQQLDIDYQHPTFTNYPGQAFDEIEALLEQHRNRQVALIGSSLGGFMATAAAERKNIRACLINPVVRPSELMPFLLGDQVNEHTGEQYHLTDQHTAEVAALELTELQQPQNYLLMLQTGDETLNYRDAEAHYGASMQIVEQGGTHRFDDFEQHLPRVLEFLQLA